MKRSNGKCLSLAEVERGSSPGNRHVFPARLEFAVMVRLPFLFLLRRTMLDLRSNGFE